MILEKGRQYGIPVLDTYHGLPIDPNLESDCKAYTIDGTHLNDAGHRVLADVVGQFLETL